MRVKVTVDPKFCSEEAEKIGLVDATSIYCDVVGISQTAGCIYLTLGLFPLLVEDLFPVNGLFLYPQARVAICFNKDFERTEAQLECFFDHEDGTTHFVSYVEVEEVRQLPYLSELMAHL